MESSSHIKTAKYMCRNSPTLKQASIICFFASLCRLTTEKAQKTESND